MPSAGDALLRLIILLEQFATGYSRTNFFEVPKPGHALHRIRVSRAKTWTCIASYPREPER
jgi:hypothetical protein